MGRPRRALASVAAATLFALAPGPAGATAPPGAPACRVFPADNVWHADISTLPVHPRSAAWKSSMSAGSKHVHPDFGPSGGSMPYGIPYTTVSSSHAKVVVEFDHQDESDPGPYPLGPETPIESGSDAHAIMIDRDRCTLYELYDTRYSPSGSAAGSGAIWSLRSNALRPAGWTSADAAGLPIFAGLVRLDEVKARSVDHAIRVTASRTDRSYLWPARHQAGAANDRNLPPMGARFRLRAGYDISRFRADTRAILTAMKRYGLIVADNGSDWFFSGTAENGWQDAMLDELKSVPASQFDAVDASSLMASASSGRVRGTAHPAPAPAKFPAAKTAPLPKPSASASAKPSPDPAPPSPSPSGSKTAGTPGPIAAPVVPARFPWGAAAVFAGGFGAGFALWAARRRQRRRA